MDGWIVQTVTRGQLPDQINQLDQINEITCLFENNAMLKEEVASVNLRSEL